MTDKEKAQAYDEALERAKKVKKSEADAEPGTSICEYIFPELRESEDERIRKELKHYLEVKRCQTQSDEEYINCNHFLDWIEKQGQKTHQTPQWMIDFLDENRVNFAYTMENYDEQREVEGKLLAIISWLEKQGL